MRFPILPWLVLWATVLQARGDECAKIGDRVARRACVDAEASAVGETTQPPAVPSTPRVVGDLSSTRPRVVDGRLLASAPSAFIGRPLLIRKAHCQYKDVNKYICVTMGNNPLEVGALIVVPAPSQVAVESRCGPNAQSLQRRCVGTVKVVPTAISLDRRGDATWVVLTAPEIQAQGDFAIR